jgi:hypothetical protein
MAAKVAANVINPLSVVAATPLEVNPSFAISRAIKARPCLTQDLYQWKEIIIMILFQIVKCIIFRIVLLGKGHFLPILLDPMEGI